MTADVWNAHSFWKADKTLRPYKGWPHCQTIMALLLNWHSLSVADPSIAGLNNGAFFSWSEIKWLVSLVWIRIRYYMYYCFGVFFLSPTSQWKFNVFSFFSMLHKGKVTFIRPQVKVKISDSMLKIKGHFSAVYVFWGPCPCVLAIVKGTKYHTFF